MPQALSKGINGAVASRYVGSESQLAQGEVFAPDGEYENWVWDATGPRPSTAVELLSGKKRPKRRELLLAFKADYALIWLIDDISVEEWKDRILGKTAASRTAAETAKVSQAATLFDKLQTKLTYLRDPARTETEVNALTWTSTP